MTYDPRDPRDPVDRRIDPAARPVVTERSGSGMTFYLLGALVVAAAVLAFLYYGSDNGSQTATNTPGIEQSTTGRAATDTPSPGPSTAPGAAPNAAPGSDSVTPGAGSATPPASTPPSGTNPSTNQ